MNATDLSCIENLSSNVGKRGERGVTGPAGVPGTYSIVGPPGQPGPSGTSRIDITMQGVEPFVPIQSTRPTVASYIYFPGSSTWGRDIQTIKVGCSFDKTAVGILDGHTLRSEITLIDSTDTSAPLDIFSQPLKYDYTVTSANRGLKEFQIVEIGDSSSLNDYVVIQNVPTGEAILQVRIKTYILDGSALSTTVPILEVYAIELT